jgi:hypothetical protein
MLLSVSSPLVMIGACTSPDLFCGLCSIEFWSALLESSCGKIPGPEIMACDNCQETSVSPYRDLELKASGKTVFMIRATDLIGV